MRGKLSCNIKCLIAVLFLFTGISEVIHSQTHIGGVINSYGHVNSIGVDNVVVNDPIQFAQFSPGDTVMLIQMKGARIYLIENPSLNGTVENTYGPAGMYEFLIIQSVNTGSKTIYFKNNILNTSFSIEGDVQIVRIPSYNHAIVDATLTCAPWDSVTKTGGVLSAIVGRTLTLNTNIDVSGKGFKGGTTAIGHGICVGTELKLDKYSYAVSTDSSGYKGEGPVTRGWLAVSNYPAIIPGFGKGKGANLLGGGGGNGRFSGGGGGSSYGAGGTGGREVATCSPTPVTGGLGGKQLKFSPLAGRFFLGGGGGSSTYLTGSVPSPGGNGGGMIIIVCDTLKGNGRVINADGGTTTGASLNAGAGGGGGGGTIAISLRSYSQILSESALTLSAKGGKGGDNAGSFGEGGGGGGGLITTSNITLPSNILKNVSGGAPGTRTGGATAGGGASGENITTFVPVLNGFLFNSIRSFENGTQTDSVCSDTFYGYIIGTIPVGGTPPYTYQWEYSTTSESAGFSPAPGTNNLDTYIPPARLTQTTWFRRIVTDNSATPLVDISKAVKVIVHQAITNNLIGKDTIICINQDPLPIGSLSGNPLNGNGIYAYQWIQNLNNTDWSTGTSVNGTGNQSGYDPLSLNTTTYYRRIVNSGTCIDTSLSVIISVLPAITGNITSKTDSVICEGKLFDPLGASVPGAGSGTYVYQWQDSIPSGTWLPAPNGNSGTTYNPDTSTFAIQEQRYFRRVVFSGDDNVCRSNSRPILLTRYHAIENNSIVKDTTICSGTVPPALAGSDPVNGTGIYTYIWQDSTRGVAWSPVGTSVSFSPPALSDTTWYRRIVNSSECSDTSSILVIKVHQPISSNNILLLSGAGSDTTICNGAVPNRLKGSIPDGGTDIPGDYAYQWSYSTDNVVFTDITTAGNLIDFQPGALSVTTWFIRRVYSGKCMSSSNTIRVIVLPSITNNIVSASQSKVCYGTAPSTLTGTPLTGGAGGTPVWLWQQSPDGLSWNTAAGVTANQQNYSPPALTAPVKYRRIIISGPNDCCIDTSNVIDIGINQLPTGTITTVNDTTVCNGSEVLLKIHLTGASGWNVIFNENSTQFQVNNITGPDTVIKHIPSATSGLSSFTYSLNTVRDQNNCLATSLTGSKKANVYRVPVANAGADDEVCGPVYKLKANPSDGVGEWSFPAQVLLSDTGDPLSLIKIDSSFTVSSVSYKFYWEERNWQCVNRDSVTITFYRRIGEIDAGADTTLFSFDYLSELEATTLLPYETGKWSIVEGSGDFTDDDSNITGISNLSKGLNIIRWKVTNGACTREDIIKLDVVDIFIPEGFSPNEDSFNNTFVITGLDLRKKWSVPDSVPGYQVAELTILNSAGTEVFYTSNRNGNEWVDWDGRNSKGVEMPEGTYYYLLKITSLGTEKVFRKSGFIILKRY